MSCCTRCSSSFLFANEKVRTNKAQVQTNKRAFAVLSCKKPFLFKRYRISAYLFKIHSTVLAYRTDKISRKLFSLINVSAYLAYPALFLFRLSRLWLYITVIILVCH